MFLFNFIFNKKKIKSGVIKPRFVFVFFCFLDLSFYSFLHYYRLIFYNTSLRKGRAIYDLPDCLLLVDLVVDLASGAFS